MPPPPSKPATEGSRLESLPVEIIQEIFLHSLEVNLPRASPRLAEALSTPALYTWLIRLAFSSTNASAATHFFTRDFLPQPLDFFALSPVERRDLQTTLLACRWCTLPLMRQCQRDYLLHTIHQKCQPGRDFLFSQQDEATLLSLKEQLSSLIHQAGHTTTTSSSSSSNSNGPGKGDLILHAHPYPNPSPTSSTSSTTTTTTTKPHRRNPHKIALYLHLGALQIRSPNDIYSSTHPFTATSTTTATTANTYRLPTCTIPSPTGTLSSRIPDKLLSPPWSSQKLEFLALLAADAYLDDTPAHDRSRRVLRQTIRAREFDVFRTLLRLRVRVPWYDFPVPWPVSVNHFFAAVKYADGPGDEFVRVLVEERLGDVEGGLTREEGERVRGLLVRAGMGGVLGL
ncbi:hypothetical protein ASPACDRAFT_123433 [Aspergillus aculeatus ATCC 16872]|uniref:Uncharacterized protein n=1 Tax=Aspergillus aculeatus (strain ATCC 16872 / CBS 172.66 / WB 5094) TaxID=690307 RepID=A0A1L9WMX5_ASPA1|nr:uncharacterized protein ASPACDRAFT_123433 [Aspergillus aculeatus ATCC 16872]OJJ97506.1 hypothetical protein ASPACDRAFT_123433 [Aspergillus aculeatus ATCC 16872]